ncbi:hypothetical protein PFISCL1PPCAC_4801 [Pristionchus fissidentatus]|uniref:Membrane transporter n=1 Tax=Pristionchus fissidentatus TaxID=1538716 RepID=A0AAV5V288_9BILA|nr:hypothetical protein PFISCL1PPCAC_4801 [Pristionchus fissidentatus]
MEDLPELPPIGVGKDAKGTSMMAMEMDTKEEVEEEKKTMWSEIYLATFITFLCSVENNMISIGEWNYLQKMDPEVDNTFFALVTSITKGGHALFAMAFALWSHRFRVSRLPLLVGRLLALLGCILYLLIEFIPVNRRYAMLFCYCLFGISFGTSPILRAFIARMSSNKSRVTAYALFSTATMFSIVIGPMAQLAFSSIAYPGIEILPGIKFHIFSAPVWIALLTNIIAILVVFFRFRDPWEHEPRMIKKNASTTSFTLEDLKTKWEAIRSLPLPWMLVGVILFEKAIANVTLGSIFSVASPLMTDVFGFNAKETITIHAVAQLMVGLFALSISGAFMFCKLNKKISSRSLLLFSICVSVILYIVSYPWPIPHLSRPMLPRNDTDNTGCSPRHYPWCDYALSPNPWIWITGMIISMGFTFPTSSIGLDTLYSRVLGDIDQTLMQGAMVLVEDVVLFFGPFYASRMFKAFSISALWTVNVFIVFFGLVVFLATYKRFKRYC